MEVNSRVCSDQSHHDVSSFHLLIFHSQVQDGNSSFLFRPFDSLYSSSMDGLFLENGPLYINERLQLYKNKYSWTQYSSVIYGLFSITTVFSLTAYIVDQPIGTGFSRSEEGLAQTQLEVAEQFVEFFDGFLDAFPYFRKAEIFIGGESFAGTYIPYIAANMVQKRPAVLLSYVKRNS